MKNFFFCAAAAIVALASCSKTQVVYNDAPQEIGFKAVTGAITKAVQPTEKDGFNQDMGVIAYNTDGLSEYFANAQFVKTTASVTTKDPETGAESTNSVTTWNGKTAQYWPIDSSLDFFVYSPYQASGVTPTNEANLKTLQVVVADNSTKQDDYLYSDKYITGKSKTPENIAVDFDHALAYVTVKFSGADVITLSNAQLNETYQSGTYTVTYGNTTSVAWSSQGTSSDLVLNAGALTTDYTTSWLVVPEDNKAANNTITFDYTIAGMTGDVISTSIPLSETWAAGTHYTYNVSIGTNEIKFTPSVNDWTTPNDVNKTL